MIRNCIYSISSRFGKSCFIYCFAIAVGLIVGCALSFVSIELLRLFHPSQQEFDEHCKTNTSVADHLRKEIRILCWVMTGPTNHKTKAQHIRHTWGRHCNQLLFMTTVFDPQLPNSITLPVEEGRDHLWAKTKEAFKYIYDHHLGDADWFLKADDDSFVVMENLRSMLHPYPPEMPIYFGRKFKIDSANVPNYMSGGAGYVISKRALTLLVESGINNASICNLGHGGAEDAELGKCFTSLGLVVAGDSRNPNGSDRFFPFSLSYHLSLSKIPDKSYWYFTYSYYYPIDGSDAVPTDAVSFHYVESRFMYIYDYLIYRLRVYGRGSNIGPIDERKFTLDEVKEILKITKKNI